MGQRLSCAGCKRLHLTQAGRPGEVFLRCRAGGSDPRFADRVLEKTHEEWAEGRAKRIVPPRWCPRRNGAE